MKPRRKALVAALTVVLLCAWTATTTAAASAAVDTGPEAPNGAAATGTEALTAASGLTAGVMPIGQPKSAVAPANARLYYYGGKVVSNISVTKLLYGSGR